MKDKIKKQTVSHYYGEFRRICPFCLNKFIPNSARHKFCHINCRKKYYFKINPAYKKKSEILIKKWYQEHPNYQKEYRAKMKYKKINE